MKKILLGMMLVASCTIAGAQKIPSVKVSEVESLFTRKTDSLYVINFWATFCKPCIEEIPYLQSISARYASEKVRLVLVSLDLPSFYPKQVKDFAKQQAFTADMMWLNETDADYFCPRIDEHWSGSIPATLIVRQQTGYKKFFESPLTAEEFERELKLALGR